MFSRLFSSFFSIMAGERQHMDAIRLPLLFFLSYIFYLKKKHFFPHPTVAWIPVPKKKVLIGTFITSSATAGGACGLWPVGCSCAVTGWSGCLPACVVLCCEGWFRYECVCVGGGQGSRGCGASGQRLGQWRPSAPNGAFIGLCALLTPRPFFQPSHKTPASVPLHFPHIQRPMC